MESKEWLSWTLQPIKTLQVVSSHLFASEGSHVLIWKLPIESQTNAGPSVIIKAFSDNYSITSFHCIQSLNTLEVIILVSTSYNYRIIHFNTSTLVCVRGPLVKSQYAEILAVHCFSNEDWIIYDINNIAIVHQHKSEEEEQRIVFKGYLPAPDSVQIIGMKIEEAILFVATSSKVNICKLTSQNDPNRIPQILSIYEFTQAKGVIFSVNFYPKLNTIITTSDERSIYIWHCDGLISEETSFNPLSSQKHTSVKLQGILEGHTSRVYNAVISGDYIVSVGEDSNVVAWDLKNLSEQYVLGSHGGSTIWAIAADQQTHEIFTGADDGSISRWCLSDTQQLMLTKLTIKKPNFPGDNTSMDAKPVKDFPRVIRCIGTNTSVVSMNSGVIAFVKDNEKVIGWHNDSKGSSYLCLTVSPNNKFYVTGTLNGKLTLKSTINSDLSLPMISNRSWSLPLPEKVMSIHFLSNSELIISTVASLIKYELNYDNEQNSVKSTTLMWTVKQKANANCTKKLENVIFVGLDNGKVKVYRDSDGKKVHQFKVGHSKLGVGDIVEYQNQIVTGGRDAKLHFFYIDSEFLQESFSVNGTVETHLKTLNLPFVWVGLIRTYKDDLLVCGFHSNDFVVYSLKQRYIFWRTNCGGGHRKWDFSFTDEGKAVFAHIGGGKVNRAEGELERQVSVQDGLHIDDINSVIEIQTSSCNSLLLVSASEDGFIKATNFFVHHFSMGAINQTKAFRRGKTEVLCVHSSAVRCIHYCAIENFKSGYLFSGGGRSELVLTKIYIDGPDLKKYERVRKYTWRSPKIKNQENPDFRIMDIKSLLLPNVAENNKESGSSVMLVGFIACSDGILRIVRENGNYLFSRSYLKASGTGKCLNNVEIQADICIGNTLVNVYCGTSRAEIICWKINLNSWDETEIYPFQVVQTEGIAITSLSISKDSLYAGCDDGSLIHWNISKLENSGRDLKQTLITNNGIFGLQMHPSLLQNETNEASKLYFVSGGCLYKSDTLFGKLCSVGIPIEDGKGILICKPIANCDFPLVTFGKGIAVFSIPLLNSDF